MHCVSLAHRGLGRGHWGSAVRVQGLLQENVLETRQSGLGSHFSLATGVHWDFFQCPSARRAASFNPSAPCPHDTGINPRFRGVLCYPQRVYLAVTPQVQRRAHSRNISELKII